MKYASRIYLCLIFGILYIPILTLILFSFNSTESTSVFGGFSFQWYVELFSSTEAFTALRNTLILAVLSALLATVIGTAAAEGIYKMRSKFIKTAVNSVTNIPMMNPDIVTGMSMMLFFAAVMAILKIGDYNDLGFLAMLISHTTFCLPYVILSVLPRITELGDTMSEAALDLGCTPFKAFLKVKLPNIMPAVLSGMVMAFTLSLDDFVISYFVAPPNFQTLPLLIYSMTKKIVKPDMYALSTIIVVTIFILLIISNLKPSKKSADRKKKKIATMVTLCTAGVVTLGIIISSFFVGGVTTSEVITLNVYNWGEYISDGDGGSFDTNAEFEKYYYEKYGKHIKVEYSTYATNEDMFSKLNNSAVSYDIVIPSDYMIQKMIEEDLLLEFDVEADIENYGNIIDSFRNPYYDPDNKYSVPYTYGMMGIIYNADVVSEEDVRDMSWGLLWNENYKGKILQFNNPRDAFATAMYWKGLDINSENPEVWDKALELLIEQKPLLQGYANDEVYGKMTNGSAAIAPYFVGDYLTMLSMIEEIDNPPNLQFYYPKEGVNYFVDAMCIPKNSKNPDVAKEYINFMLSEEVGVANSVYIGYASPNKLVQESEEYLDEMGEEWISLLYDNTPEEVNARYNSLFGNDPFAGCYESFSPSIQARTNTLWENLKLADSTETWVHVSAILIVLAVLSLGIYKIYIRKRRSKTYRARDKELRKQRALKLAGTVSDDKTNNYVNPVLGYSLFFGSLVLAISIGLIIILPRL